MYNWENNYLDVYIFFHIKSSKSHVHLNFQWLKWNVSLYKQSFI